MTKLDARVLLSGGMDSTICLAWAQARYSNVDAVFFEYGQRHLEQERSAARFIAGLFGVTLHERPVRYLKGGLVDGDDLSAAGAVVPGRNRAFLMGAIAPGELPSVLVMGCNRDDWREFEDCRPAFFAQLGLPFGIKIETPLLYTSKGQALLMAERLGCAGIVNERAWSCYAGGDEPCGECGACRARAKAVDDAETLRKACPFCGAGFGQLCFHPSHGYTAFHAERRP